MKAKRSANPLKPFSVSRPARELAELPSLGMDAAAIALDIRRYFGTFLGRDKYCRSSHYPYQALVFALRDRLMERSKQTRQAYETGAKHATTSRLNSSWGAH
jgi:starch phosphorylase